MDSFSITDLPDYNSMAAWLARSAHSTVELWTGVITACQQRCYVAAEHNKSLLCLGYSCLCRPLQSKHALKCNNHKATQLYLAWCP